MRHRRGRLIRGRLLRGALEATAQLIAQATEGRTQAALDGALGITGSPDPVEHQPQTQEDRRLFDAVDASEPTEAPAATKTFSPSHSHRHDPYPQVVPAVATTMDHGWPDVLFFVRTVH